MEIRLPALAEGSDTGTVVNLLVAVGDRIRKDQTVLELENQKAVAPIPSPVSGKVTQLHVKVGDVVLVGQALVSVEEESGSISVRGESVEPETPSALRQAQGERKGQQSAEGYLYTSRGGFPPPTSPSLRRMARELGVDLARVRGSGLGGRITAEDIRLHLAALQGRAAGPVPVPGKPPATKSDFAKWGPVTRKPFSALRQVIARTMTDSWATIPHVTQFDEADVTQLLQWIKKHGASYEKKGGRLTLTAVLILALTPVLRKYPIFNASLDESAGEIVYKEYIHLGIAVDTQAGLIVPVLRDADKKDLLELCRALQDLADRARNRKITLEQLQGSSFTISNQGGIGGLHFTPIIHKPEVAVLGLGQARRGILPLSLSYDHRVIDGADAARFTRDLAQSLEELPESEVQA